MHMKVTDCNNLSSFIQYNTNVVPRDTGLFFILEDEFSRGSQTGDELDEYNPMVGRHTDTDTQVHKYNYNWLI